MNRLRSKLLSLNKSGHEAKIYTPALSDVIRIPFQHDKLAKVVGRLANIPPPTSTDPEDSQILSGVLVQNGFKLSLMAPEDLREYAGLTTTTITCKQHICLASASVELIKWSLESTFGGIEELQSSIPKVKETNGLKDEVVDEVPLNAMKTLLVMDCVKVIWLGSGGQIEIEWEGNVVNDGVADAVMAVLLTVESSPAAIKFSSSGHEHRHRQTNGETKRKNIFGELSPEERFQRLCMFLEEQFGDSVTPIETPKLVPRISAAPPKKEEDENGVKDEEASEEDDDDTEEQEAAERARLAGLGIPVPGLEIKVDKLVAKLWLETLEVECANRTLGDRVRAVVERAVETVAPLWTMSKMPQR